MDHSHLLAAEASPADPGAHGLAPGLEGRCVLEICRVPFVGGAERIALNSAQAVRGGGGRAIIACPPGGHLEATVALEGLEGRSIAALSGRRGPAADLARALWATLRNREVLSALVAQERVDLVHAHHPIGAYQAAQAARRAGAPIVLHVHETLPVPRQYAALAGWLRRGCDAFVCVSDAGRELLRSLGAPEARIHLVYNAVGPAFLGSPRPAELEGKAGPHIGVFGVLEPRKGQADLIKALGRLSGDHPAARLWIVGELSYAGNAAYIDELKTLAAASGVGERVHFTGYRRDIPELMAAMDVVVLASREFESLPTVLLESAALGRVSVATDVGGVREILTDGVTGLVVPPSDPAALADALAAALAPEAARLGRAAREMARTRFSPVRFERDLLGLFGDLVSAGRTPGR
ncbi:glycosyltransferase [Phenylobacterium sp.]|uniref:glycosyltransferase n=1 Tax=Phenylobacterium sp. TaxID=1871053 RepID=UPI0035B2661F